MFQLHAPIGYVDFAYEIRKTSLYYINALMMLLDSLWLEAMAKDFLVITWVGYLIMTPPKEWIILDLG